MKKFHLHTNAPTPQTQVIPGRETEMKPNSGGGVAFTIDDFKRLDRFLILGSEATFYASAKKLTIENAKCVLRCIQADGARTVQRIVEISTSRRAPKNDSAVFALALCAAKGSIETKKLAFAAVSAVARIPTDLFHFTTYALSERGWGRGLRNAVRAWYETKDADKLAYLMVKYKQRDGWSQADMIRLAKPRFKDEPRMALATWAAGRDQYEGSGPERKIVKSRDVIRSEAATRCPKIVANHSKLFATDPTPDIPALIREFGFTHEMLPTECKTSPAVWEALLMGRSKPVEGTDEMTGGMPMTAMIRNLGVMSACGLVSRASAAEKFIVERLSSDEVRKAKIHPFNILLAAATYRKGHGDLGNKTWDVSQAVDAALSDAFEKSFGNVVPTEKRWLIGLDISSSMNSEIVSVGDDGKVRHTGVTSRQASAAMAMISMRVERDVMIYGFHHNFIDLNKICNWKRDTLQTICAAIDQQGFGRTDCALPMLQAEAKNWRIDMFAIYTDNETNRPSMHPTQALQRYRKSSGIQARSAVCAFSTTDMTIADPKDPGQLDCVGLDSNLPQILSSFATGDI